LDIGSHLEDEAELWLTEQGYAPLLDVDIERLSQKEQEFKET
jgi:hypothetical protein